MRRQLIDYYGTRWGKLPISQEELLVHETTNHRLLRYSTFGWDKLPISQEKLLVHEATNHRLLRYSTVKWDKFPISQEELFVHEATNHRLLWYSTSGWDKLRISQKDLFVHETIIYRLLQYSILRWDQLPISQKGFFFSRPWDGNWSITSVLDPRMGQVPYLQEGLSHPKRWQFIDCYALDFQLLKMNPSSSRRQLADYHSTRPTNNLSFFHKGTTRPQDDKKIDYYYTRKKWFKTADDKLHKKGNQPTGRQIKGKKYYTSQC